MHTYKGMHTWQRNVIVILVFGIANLEHYFSVSEHKLVYEERKQRKEYSVSSAILRISRKEENIVFLVFWTLFHCTQ